MDAFTTFTGLIDRHENCFLFETLAGNPMPDQPRRHYIGVAPDTIITDPLELSRTLDMHASIDTSGYNGRLVGFMSHEAIACFEPVVTFDYDRRFPDCMYGLYRDGLVFEADGSGRYFTTGQNRQTLYEPTALAARKLQITPVHTLFNQSAYTRILQQAIDDISQGRVFQTVLANKYTYDYTGDLLQLYARLRDINPSSYMFFIKFGDVITMGASPELLSYTAPDGRTSIEALAGTIRRSHDASEDAKLARKLGADEKELAEHRMLVDLVRNDLGRVSRFGSVRIDELMYIKKLSHVQHLCSLVSGQLQPGKTMFDALAACFPTGTLTGAPKIEAMQMIGQLETSERGPWGGGIGYFGFNGQAMHAVNIRSVSASGRQLYMHSGSGVVYDSKPDREYAEISAKKAAMDRAMEPFLEPMV